MINTTLALFLKDKGRTYSLYRNPKTKTLIFRKTIILPDDPDEEYTLDHLPETMTISCLTRGNIFFIDNLPRYDIHEITERLNHTVKSKHIITLFENIEKHPDRPEMIFGPYQTKLTEYLVLIQNDQNDVTLKYTNNMLYDTLLIRIKENTVSLKPYDMKTKEITWTQPKESDPFFPESTYPSLLKFLRDNNSSNTEHEVLKELSVLKSLPTHTVLSTEDEHKTKMSRYYTFRYNVRNHILAV